MRIIAAFAAATALAACMSEADTSTVGHAADQFYERQAQSNDTDIYNSAAPALRAAASLTDVTRLNNAVRGASCPIEKTQQGWNNTQSTSGHFVTISYLRHCARGDIVETFRWQVAGENAILLAYNANGMALFPEAPPQPADAPATETSDTPTATVEAPPPESN